MSAHPSAATVGTLTRWLRARALLWTALVVLLVAALSLLVALTFHYRSSRMQAAVEANAATAADQLVQLLERNLQALAEPIPDALWSALDDAGYVGTAQAVGTGITRGVAAIAAVDTIAGSAEIADAH